MIQVRVLKNQSTRIELYVDAPFVVGIGLEVDIDDERSLNREWFLDPDVDDIPNPVSPQIDSLAAANRCDVATSGTRRLEDPRALQGILEFSGKDWVGPAGRGTGIPSAKWIVGIALVLERIDHSIDQSPL